MKPDKPEKGENCGIVLYRRNLNSRRATPSESLSNILKNRTLVIMRSDFLEGNVISEELFIVEGMNNNEFHKWLRDAMDKSKFKKPEILIADDVKKVLDDEVKYWKMAKKIATSSEVQMLAEYKLNLLDILKQKLLGGKRG